MMHNKVFLVICSQPEIPYCRRIYELPQLQKRIRETNCKFEYKNEIVIEHAVCLQEWRHLTQLPTLSVQQLPLSVLMSSERITNV